MLIRFGKSWSRFFVSACLPFLFGFFCLLWSYLYYRLTHYEKLASDFFSTPHGQSSSYDEYLFFILGLIVLCLIVVLGKITQILVSHQEELRTLRESFTNILVHDLRGPLDVIRGYAELSTQHMDPAVQESSRLIFDTSKLLIQRISQVLDVQKMQNSADKISTDLIDLVRLSREIVTTHKNSAREREVSLLITHESQQLLSWVSTDAYSRILGNLISNAIKFSPAGEVVTITLAPDKTTKKFNVITVQDHGPGIPIEKQSSIFQPFYQAHTNQSVSSSGLGLTSAKILCEQMGGSISFSSDNNGTLFMVTLPNFKSI